MNLHPTAMEFFHGQVTDALRAHDVRATEPTEFYLVNLLVEFTSATVSEEPLALKLARVQEAPTTDGKVKGLKEIGDQSLYVSGFFADSLAHKLVDINYYVAMGANAYQQLAGLIPMARGSAATFFRDVYGELARNFDRFVEVLQEIRRNTSFAGGANLLRLYEAYVRGGGEWLERRLKEAGLFVGTGAKAN